MEHLDEKKIFEFLALVNSLKTKVRRGWQQVGCDNPESIASHMYSMAMMTFLLGDNTKLNRVHCMQLALVHDLAESIVGDITPDDNIPVETKHQMEEDAMKKIVEPLDEETRKIIYDLFMEYEARETPEAKFVKDLDRFDLIFTAWKYEQNGSVGKCQKFFDATKGQIEHPFVQRLANALNQTRDNEKLPNGHV